MIIEFDRPPDMITVANHIVPVVAGTYEQTLLVVGIWYELKSFQVLGIPCEGPERAFKLVNRLQTSTRVDLRNATLVKQLRHE